LILIFSKCLSSCTKIVTDMKKTKLAIFASVAALGLVAVTALDTLVTAEEVQGAKSAVGECASALKNASAQICHNFQSSNSAEQSEDNAEETEEPEDEAEDNEETED